LFEGRLSSFCSLLPFRRGRALRLRALLTPAVLSSSFEGVSRAPSSLPWLFEGRSLRSPTSSTISSFDATCAQPPVKVKMFHECISLKGYRSA
jgi:hypothetical protein